MPGKQEINFTVRDRSESDHSNKLSLKAPSLKSPRTARFAEATAVNSPIEPSQTTTRAVAVDPPPTYHFMAEPQIADVGFGSINKHESVEMPNTDDQPPVTARTIPKSPLKSAIKTPGAPPKDLNAILSPTFREEQILEKTETFTDRKQAADLRIKTRVRVAKFLLRGVNLSCSLIVLSMLSSTFSIFNATKSIPPRNNLPPWAENQKIWPQVLLLCISCVSLFASICVLFAYWKGGHKMAEKRAVWTTVFAVAYFIFSTIMWALGAAVLQHSRNTSGNKDMWGWACVNNERKSYFENEVDYNLICRLQNWSLVCAIIEIVVELIAIGVYGIIFYRFYSKRQLRRTMAVRDRARSDMYTAQLRSAPNTPGPNGPLSARDGGWKPPVDYFKNMTTIEEGEVRYVDPDAKPREPPTAFRLQAPPIRIHGATPKMEQMGFTPMQTNPTITTTMPPPQHQPSRTPSPPEDSRSPLMGEMPREVQQEHFAAAPGERVYEEVPIPGAYEAPLSPGADAPHMQFGIAR